MFDKITTGHWPTMDARYINENSLVLNTFEPHFYNDFLEFIIPKNKFYMNNKQKSNKNCNYEMRKKRRLKIRSKEEFISEIRKLSKQDIRYRNYNHLRKIKRNDLIYEAVKLFGGWRNAIEATGFRPIQKGWTNRLVINEIKRIVSEIGYVPRSKEVTKLGYIGVSTAARRRYGSWSNALTKAGFKPFRKKWSEEGVISELKKVYQMLGYSPSMRDLKELNKYDLLNAGIKFFGKYNKFLNAANIPIVLEMDKWPKSKIIKELQKIQQLLGRSPRRTELAAMKRYDIINAAERYFSSWTDALITAGLIPNSDVLNDDKTWREWEDLVFDMLLKQGIKYKKKKYIKKVGYPDVFIPSQNKIIEVKINCSDNSVKKDIEKYLPYCARLEIWYLFGKPFGILSNKVYFVGPNKIKDMIKNDFNLLRRFNKLKNQEENKCETN